MIVSMRTGLYRQNHYGYIFRRGSLCRKISKFYTNFKLIGRTRFSYNAYTGYRNQPKLGNPVCDCVKYYGAVALFDLPSRFARFARTHSHSADSYYFAIGKLLRLPGFLNSPKVVLLPVRQLVVRVFYVSISGK